MGCISLLLALNVVTTAPTPEGHVLARQAVPATGVTRAESKVIYLEHNGASLRPGDNDSSAGISSIVDRPTTIRAWDIDDDTWQATVDCMREIYAPFDVTITDEDPGDVPHIEAVFGGSPVDVGLPENVAGVSPFTEDCAIIERSIVFAFTDVMNDDPRTVCEVAAQEVAHSFGLDHELLASDPMTYLPYVGERTFQDDMVSCGEYGNRMCGINGSVCRQRQNSFQLLAARLGTRDLQSPTGDDGQADQLRSGVTSGCDARGGTGRGIGLVILVGHLAVRRRSRHRRPGAVLQ